MDKLENEKTAWRSHSYIDCFVVRLSIYMPDTLDDPFSVTKLKELKVFHTLRCRPLDFFLDVIFV